MNGSLSTTTALLGAAALLVGAMVPLQAGSNAALARGLGHPLWATLISLLVSVVVLLPLLISFRVNMPQWSQTAQLPLWMWFGGLVGVFYLTAGILIIPRLGATGFMVAVIAGQIVASLIIDQFGLLGLPQKEINWGRITGVLLIIAGVILVQWHTRTTH